MVTETSEKQKRLTGKPTVAEILLRVVLDQKIHNQQGFCNAYSENSIKITGNFTLGCEFNVIIISYKLVNFFKFAIDEGRGPVIPLLYDRSLYRETTDQK